MAFDLSNTLSGLLAFVILLDQHLYGGLILKGLAQLLFDGIRAWRQPSSCGGQVKLRQETAPT
jgi:hypothetical protein